MTKNQRIHLMRDLWPAACRAQGWAPNDRARRIALCGLALGRKLQSTNEINSTDEFDRVKAHLLMAADNIQGAQEVDHPEAGDARRWRFMLERMVKCLAVYVGDTEAYLKPILSDQFGGRHPELLKAHEIERLLMTVTSRTHGFRSQMGDTIEQMERKAGLRKYHRTPEVHPHRIEHEAAKAAALVPF